MSQQDRERWEPRHRQRSSAPPRPSLSLLPSAVRGGAVALDLACGQGRHALALQRMGYAVLALDVAFPALVHLLESGEHQGNPLLAVQADVDEWPLAQAAFDAIVQVDFLDRRLFPVLEASLRTGGCLLVDTFLDVGGSNASGPANPAFRLQPDELPHAFPGLEVLHYEEQHGPTNRAVMLARRPARN